MKKGLLCGILENKSTGNCSNDGISSKCSKVVLIDDAIDQVFEPSPEAPAVVLVWRTKDYVCAVPVDKPKGVIGPMFGGSFIYSSDSRFPSKYPIPLHDRFETVEQYDILSR